MIIVDLRDEFIEKDEALGLFVVLMQLFADAQREARFNKLVVFDEAHKYIDSPDLVDGLVSSVREMRHKGMSVLVASQDPPSVPIKLIELSDVVDPAQVQLARLAPPHAEGDRLARGPEHRRRWRASRLAKRTSGPASLPRRNSPAARCRMRLRPRITQHGGATKTAVE